MLGDDPWEWRALWVDGLAAMLEGDWDDAKASFNAVYQQVPGELAPKLALARRLRERRPARRRRGPLPDLRDHRRGVRRPGRLRDGAGARRRGRHRRRRRRARPGAGHQPRLPREPAAAGRGPARPGSTRPAPCSTRRCAASSRRGWTRPTLGRYTVRILRQALGWCRRRRQPAEREDRAAPGRRDEPARRARAGLPRLARDARSSPSGRAGQPRECRPCWSLT